LRQTPAAPARRRAGMLALGILALAFVSPLCPLANALFALRAVHHLLLILVAAPLLALAWPGRTAHTPVPALLLSTISLWFWHWPTAYTAALASPFVYWAMQASLLGSFTLFWRRVLHSDHALIPALLAIVGAAAAMGLLGAILTFAPRALYAEHARWPLVYGLSTLEDQQLAGLIMWVPAMAPFLLLAALILHRSWPVLSARA